MSTVTVSPKYQIVIPKEIRESLNIRPGQKLAVLKYEHRIELIPFEDIRSLRGLCRGMDTSGYREEEDEERP